MRVRKLNLDYTTSHEWSRFKSCDLKNSHELVVLILIIYDD